MVVTRGAVHGLAMAFDALVASGEPVLLPDPELPSRRMAAVPAGGEGTVRVSFASSPDALRDGLTRLADLVHTWDTLPARP